MLIDKDDLLDEDSFNDFNVSDQERLVIAAIGESGEGKSALLNLVGVHLCPSLYYLLKGCSYA